MATKSKNNESTKPKRFRSAYNFFLMHERAAHIDLHPDESSTSSSSKAKNNSNNSKVAPSSKELAQKWKTMSSTEKKEYKKLAEQDLARYRKELREYDKKKRDAAWDSFKLTIDFKSTGESSSSKTTSTTTTAASLPVKVISNDNKIIRSQRKKREKGKFAKNKKTEESSSPLANHQKTKMIDQALPSATISQAVEPKDKFSSLSQIQIVTNQEGNYASSNPNKKIKLSLSTEDDKKVEREMDNLDSTTVVDNVTVDSDSMETFSVGNFSLMSTILNDNTAASNNKKQGGNNSNLYRWNSDKFEIVYESLSTRILYIPQQQTGEGASSSSGSNTGHMAVKLLTDQFPEPSLQSRLQNEYKMSQFLVSQKCNSTRPALQLIQNDVMNALCLGWVNGVTLKEYIKSVHNRKLAQDEETSSSSSDQQQNQTVDIESLVKLAKKVTKALADIHDCGVAHNNITAENIIVKIDNDEEDKVNNNNNVSSSNSITSVKMIDLGQASILSGKQDGGCDNKQNDLCSLGAVLFELFVGMDCGTKGRQRNGGVYQLHQDLRSLLRSKVPLCISTIILNLIERRKGEVVCHYTTAKKVDQDFSTILDNPEYCHMRHQDESVMMDDKIIGNINIFNVQKIAGKKKLYGRDKEASLLMDAYDRISQSGGASSEMMIVSGYSGAGKSTLVQQMRKPVTDRGGIFLCGKFDQLQQMEPLSAITAPFTDLFKKLVKREDENKIHQTRTAIKEAIGSETDVLANVIPSLRHIIKVPIAETINKVGGMEAQNRFKYIFRLFVRAIATPAQPLVLFLDDLQWADTASLNLVESLITDADSTSLLLVGSYRENEVGKTHPLAATLHRIQSKKIPTAKITVGNLSKNDTNELISDIIQTSPFNTESLTDVVYRKTSGHVIFVLQFLSSLCDEGLLNFSLESKSWQWNTAVIDSKNIADNVVELMSCKILQLPKTTQHALKLIACLGSFCEESVLRMVVVVPNDAGMIALNNNNTETTSFGQSHPFCIGYADLISSLESAVKEGLIYHVDSKYVFVHDMIQFSSYCLIPEEERGHWHLWIGNQVWANKAASPEKALFIAVGQLNKSISHIQDTNQRVELAELNLKAGEKCISLAAFAPASVYLKTGIVLLDKSCWLDHYDLCRQLYDLYAEVKYCEGEFEEMNKVVNETFSHARCFNDKVRSFFTLVRALLAQGKPQEALKVGLPVLAQLGEPINTTADRKAITMIESLKTERMFEGKTDEYLLSMKEMNHKNKIAAVRLLKILALSAYTADQQLYPLLVFRMVQITLTYGICKECVISFASYGGLLACIFHETDKAYRFGRLSLYLLTKLEAKESLAQVYLTFYCSIHSGIKTHHASLEPMRHAYEVGMRCGNIFYAMSNAMRYCVHLFECGNELSMVETMCKEYGEKMLEHKLPALLKHSLPYRQTVLNLMGRSNDPLQLTGEAMDQDTLLKYALEGRRMALVSTIYHLRSWLAYMFGDYELASKMAEDSKLVSEHWSVLNLAPFVRSNYVFVDGLISFAIAQSKDEEKWKKLGCDAMETMKIFAEQAPSNFQHKCLLLRAESMFLAGDSMSASKYYDAAIKTAGENGFIQDQAIAYERAGIFHFSEGNASSASHYYGQAHATYLKWGASCKADHLRLYSPI